MAKHVIRYLLEGDGSVPTFVQEGGHFKQNEELVGISVDDQKRYLPATVHKLTREELVARVLAVSTTLDGDPIDSEQAEEIVNNLLSANGMSDY